MTDYLISPSIIELYQSSKNKDWRKQVKGRQTVIFKFLEDNNLSLISLLEPSGEAKEDLTLMRSHLTENGAKLFEKAVPAWERARDKDGDLSNLDALRNGLKKIIDQSR